MKKISTNKSNKATCILIIEFYKRLDYFFSLF